MKSFFHELKRRNVYKVALTYAIVTWLIVQIGSVVFETINAPQWVMQVLLFFVIIGFPIALILAWAFEMSPEGMIRTSSLASEENPYSSRKKKPLTSNIFIGVLALIIIGQFAYNKYTNKAVVNSTNTNLSIAVLPFDNMSSDKENQWFCDGVTEDILTHLSKIKGLKVISRTSTERYKETDKTIPEIARELGVSYVVEGSVRKQNNTVLITAQLIKANDEHLWADNYNEKLDDVFKIQQDVSKKIVQQLKIAISPEEEQQLAAVPTKNMKAYELLLKARSFSDKGTKEDYFISIDLYEQAIALDSDFAEAYAEMASNYIVNSYLDMNNYDQYTYKAIELVDKALMIDLNSSKALAIKGFLYLSEDRNYEQAKKYLEKALELNTNDVLSNQYMAIYYGENGPYKDLNKSLYHINKAAELDPFSAVINEYKITILMDNKNLNEAEELFKNKIFLFSDYNRIFLQNNFIRFRSEAISIEKQDWMEQIRYYEKEIERDSLNPFIYLELGNAYEDILNDNKNLIKYAKTAYEMDSTETYIAINYFISLINGKKFIEALKILNSENYKSILSESHELLSMVFYYYYKEEYNAALEVLKDTLITDKYTFKAYVLAQQGKLKELRNILNKKDVISDMGKVRVFAILENRDSMYYYLDKEKDMEYRIGFNGSREADPYRKEERYKEYLRENYLPITHWNE